MKIEGLTVNPWKTGGAGYFWPLKTYDVNKSGNPGVNGPYLFPAPIEIPEDRGRTLAVWPRKTAYFDFWEGRFELTDELFAVYVKYLDEFYRTAMERLSSALQRNIAESAWSNVERYLRLFDAWFPNPLTHWREFGPLMMPIDRARWCLKFMSYQDMYEQERAMITGAPGRWEAARRSAANLLAFDPEYATREGRLNPTLADIPGMT